MPESKKGKYKMKKILFFIIICLTTINAHEYKIFDINGKNRGSYYGEINKVILANFIKKNHGSILIKKDDFRKTNSIKNPTQKQILSFTNGQIKNNIDINRDSLINNHWFETEKNEIVKLCLDNKVLAWETSLDSKILNDSCLIFQASTFIGVDTIKLYFSDNDFFQNINLANGLKYLKFQNNEILLGFNNYDPQKLKTDVLHKNEDPERLVTVNGLYLVDKYPITNCEFTQLMWDKIPTKPAFTNSNRQEIALKWAYRKKNSTRNSNCIAHDSAANTIFLSQAMEYANTRSVREGLKPYYIFSETNFNEPSILSENNFIIAYFDFTKNEDKYVQISVDSSSNGYRLPYYDEWVMFARGGDKVKKAPWGDSTATFTEAQKYAKFVSETNLYEADPVGQLLPNGYGLYDIFGLVWEHVLFEKKNPFKTLNGRPSCLKGGDDQVRENHIWYKAYRNPYWKWINYGYFKSNYSSGVEAGFRLIRKLK